MLLLYYFVTLVAFNELARVAMGLAGYLAPERQYGAWDVLSGMLGLVFVGFVVRAIRERAL